MFEQTAKGVALMYQEKGFLVVPENTPHPVNTKL